MLGSLATYIRSWRDSVGARLRSCAISMPLSPSITSGRVSAIIVCHSSARTLQASCSKIVRSVLPTVVLALSLQEFSWTESGKDAARAQRSSSLTLESSGLIQKEPLFCFEVPPSPRPHPDCLQQLLAEAG